MFGWSASKKLADLAGEMRGIIREHSDDDGKSLSGVEGPAALLQKLAEMLSYEQALHYGLLQSIPIPLFYIDKEEHVLYTNSACMSMLQIEEKPEAYYGKTLSEVFYNEVGRSTLLKKCIDFGDVYRNKELIIVSRKGNRLNVLCNLFPLYDKKGTCFGGMGLYQDITEQRDLEARLEEKNKQTAAIASRLDEVTLRTSDLAKELLAIVQQTSGSAREQAGHLAEINATILQMHTAIQSIAASAGQAAEISENASGSALQGAKSVDEVLDGTGRMQHLATGLKQEMSQLSGHAAGINSVMNVISDIADQTNLLALNAAIEAARAGDAGRGFAVVAGEVRKLAEKTMQATQNVGKTVLQIQQSTTANTEAVDKTVSTIDGTADLASVCGAALKDIVRFSSRTSERIQGIAASAEEQSSLSQSIVQSVEVSAGASRDIDQRMTACLDGLQRLELQVEDLHSLSGELIRNI